MTILSVFFPIFDHSALRNFFPLSTSSEVLTGVACNSPRQLIPLVVICYCGAIGNVATMMVMAPFARKKSTAFVLCLLAIFDTGAICTNTLDCFLQVTMGQKRKKEQNINSRLINRSPTGEGVSAAECASEASKAEQAK